MKKAPRQGEALVRSMYHVLEHEIDAIHDDSPQRNAEQGSVKKSDRRVVHVKSLQMVCLMSEQSISNKIELFIP